MVREVKGEDEDKVKKEELVEDVEILFIVWLDRGGIGHGGKGEGI